MNTLEQCFSVEMSVAQYLAKYNLEFFVAF